MNNLFSVRFDDDTYLVGPGGEGVKPKPPTGCSTCASSCASGCASGCSGSCSGHCYNTCSGICTSNNKYDIVGP